MAAFMATATSSQGPKKPRPRQQQPQQQTTQLQQQQQWPRTSSSSSSSTTMTSTDPTMELTATTPGTPADFVRRLDLSDRCAGATSMTHTPIDLSRILADPSSLQSMARELMGPFDDDNVDLVITIHSECDHPNASGAPAVHRFNSVIAGAIAAVATKGFGELTVFRPRETQRPTTVAVESTPPPKKRGRPSKKAATAVTAAPSPPSLALSESVSFVASTCSRIAQIHAEDEGLWVELKRNLIKTGARVLLVVDWLDAIPPVLAAKYAIERLGGEVIGVTCVVATNASLLADLMQREIRVACSWAPSAGAHLTTATHATGDHARCLCERAKKKTPESSPVKKRKRSLAIGSRYQHRTSHYPANAPSEDRSCNSIKTSDPDVRVYAVFDGHGGSIAVEHVTSRLCSSILATVSSQCNRNEVISAIREAFIRTDEDLKAYLNSLPLDTRMSKGYCNTGACAVVALIVGSTLYVANIGDSSAVLGHVDEATNEVLVRELSVEHNCKNSSEVRMVLERSKDRNAIRLSKDESGSPLDGNYGIKRVAGSLAVTRAFGDFYLKDEELSSPPFKSKVPYITVEPSISVHDIGDQEQFLVLASDGLWEVLNPDEAIRILQSFDHRQTQFFASSSAALVHCALEKVAHRDAMLLHELLALPPGADRRRFHDDITCTVVRIARHHLDENNPPREEASVLNVVDDDAIGTSSVS